MNDFEQELRGKLNARADAVLVDDDWDDLTTRMMRRARNATRMMALALVLVVCAASVAVVAVVRSDDSAATAAKVGPKPGSGADRVVPTHAQVPTVPAASSSSSRAGFGAASQPGSSASTAPLVLNGSSASTVYESSPAWIAVGVGDPGTPMARVFTRTTASGMTIRAYRADVVPPTSAGPPWWTPAAWCFPNAYARADVSDDAIAGATMTGLYAAQKDGSVVGGSVQLIGQAEQARRWIVIAHGPATTAKLRATFPGGASDEMAPVDGIAVLVAKAPADATDTKVTLTALDATGNELGHTTIGGDATSTISGISLGGGTVNAQAECFAPQTLPAPGASQPADAAATRQAVIDAFNTAYTHGVSDDSFAAAFDDAHGFADLMAKLRTGPYKEQVATAQMKFDNLVFLSPTKAAIQYEIDIPNYSVGSFSNRFNEANLVDGKWKLARYGWCNDVALAGVQCPG